MPTSAPKILIIRFSSIGDIVLTTPVIRSVKMALPESEVHFLTKSSFHDLLRYNPHVDRVHTLSGNNWRELSDQLRAERYDAILDLHHNLRSLRVTWALRVPRAAFDKQNFAKYLMVRRNVYPHKMLSHVVERYGNTLSLLGVTLDEAGLEIFYPAELRSWAANELAPLYQAGTPLAVVLGATKNTKRWLPAYFLETLQRLGRPVLLLGGKDATDERDFLMKHLMLPCYDAVNKTSLLESTALLDQVTEVLTHDTGLMHIAAALQKKVYSIWGNTVPAFGMSPYRTPSVLLENTDIACRPCSKIGFDLCPRGHFHCMKTLLPAQVVAAIQEQELPQKI